MGGGGRTARGLTRLHVCNHSLVVAAVVLLLLAALVAIGAQVVDVVEAVGGRRGARCRGGGGGLGDCGSDLRRLWCATASGLHIGHALRCAAPALGDKGDALGRALASRLVGGQLGRGRLRCHAAATAALHILDRGLLAECDARALDTWRGTTRDSGVESQRGARLGEQRVQASARGRLRGGLAELVVMGLASSGALALRRRSHTCAARADLGLHSGGRVAVRGDTVRRGVGAHGLGQRRVGGHLLETRRRARCRVRVHGAGDNWRGSSCGCRGRVRDWSSVVAGVAGDGRCGRGVVGGGGGHSAGSGGVCGGLATARRARSRVRGGAVWRGGSGHCGGAAAAWRARSRVRAGRGAGSGCGGGTAACGCSGGDSGNGGAW